MLQARIALLVFATILLAAMWSSDRSHQAEAARTLVTSSNVMYRNQIPLQRRIESSSYSGTSVNHSQPEIQFCALTTLPEPTVLEETSQSQAMSNADLQAELKYYSAWLTHAQN